jgi:hypothetical protein
MTLSLKENEYIMAATAMGERQVRVLFRHLLPNALATLFVMATLYIATAIRTEASLSFLGLGVPLPAPSWGNILSEGQSHVGQAPRVTGFSGLAILIAVLAFNLLGDALRDVMDPRLRGGGPMRSIVEIIKEIKALDDYTVRLTIDRPDSPFLMRLTHHRSGCIYSKKAMDNQE